MIELRVFGSCTLTSRDGVEVTGVITQTKPLALLVYLMLATPRGFHRRDRLVGLFWPELDQDRARAALRKSVHVLRRELDDRVVVNRGDEEMAIAAGTVQCDALDLETAVDAGRPGRALELYAGELLAGVFVPAASEFERWLDERRLHYRTLASTAAWVLAQRQESEAQTTLAVASARRALALAPLDERVVRKVIAMLDRVGDRAGALALYESFRVEVAAELDVEPSPETQELVAMIRNRRPGKRVI